MAFAHTELPVHDRLDPYDLVADEITQRGETGHDVDAARLELNRLDRSDHIGLRDLYDSVISLRQSPSWTYEEPSKLTEIVESFPDGRAIPAEPIRPSTVADKILGGWLGRIAGCNLGKPVEDGSYWTSARLRAYLERADAYPLRDYIPVLEPMPSGFKFNENWPHTTRGRIHGSDRDDDIDYSILGLDLLEHHGGALRPSDVAAAWLTMLPYLQVYTAERAAYRNLVDGIPIGDVAVTRNPYREWIGAQIRGDTFGWVNPGRPRTAALLAFQDASLSHVANGIYGEMWSAALVSCAFTAGDPREAIEASLEHVPSRSRLCEAIREVLLIHASGASWDDALAHIQARFGHYGWVHTINNAAVVVAGLLWGRGDFATTVGLTVQSGWDTDSNGATAGSVVGVLVGAAALPDHFVLPLEDRTRSALFGYDNSRISDLATRTARLAQLGVAPTMVPG